MAPIVRAIHWTGPVTPAGKAALDHACHIARNGERCARCEIETRGRGAGRCKPGWLRHAGATPASIPNRERGVALGNRASEGFRRSWDAATAAGHLARGSSGPSARPACGPAKRARKPGAPQRFCFPAGGAQSIDALRLPPTSPCPSPTIRPSRTSASKPSARKSPAASDPNKGRTTSRPSAASSRPPNQTGLEHHPAIMENPETLIARLRDPALDRPSGLPGQLQ